MKTFKQLILKSILLMTIGLGIFFIFSSIQKKAHYKKVDEVQSRQEQYENGCKYLATWTTKQYKGIRELNFYSYSNYGAGGKFVNAYVNGDKKLVFSYAIDDLKNKKVDIYRLDIVNSDLMKKHGIFEQKSNDENFVKIKVNLREE